MSGLSNRAFADDHNRQVYYANDNHSVKVSIGSADAAAADSSSTTAVKLEEPATPPTNRELQPDNDAPQREQWGSEWEFLMSCISLSVGLGNVWRFPFTALENGGGAFIIPYLIVLFAVGKPVYYLEMLIGQFSSRGSVRVFDFAPALRGVGIGQVWTTVLVTSYYASLLALTIRFLISSVSATLPWSYCEPEWRELGNCIDSAYTNRSATAVNGSALGAEGRLQTSAEMYFYKVVLKEKANIDDGIGLPDWKLVLCLAGAWILIAMTLLRGIKSSGKASYFFAIFPYVIMGVLLVRAVTLPGSARGILYFLTPQFDQLLNPKVWYAAVTQVFFSLAICVGNIIMYSSFNRFTHNVYRDTMIVTTLDTCTSLVAGIIIFGILGNLAFVTGTEDIQRVVQGGTGLAFVSYPDAIAKFEWAPQVFAGVFFFMLFVLGIGTCVGMSTCLLGVLRDRFTQLDNWKAAVGIATVQFAVGLLYVTPGGQFLLNFVDFFGASFVAFLLAIAELVAFGWVYGVSQLCRDVEFMLGRKTGRYWRICWGLVTPALMVAIILYHLATWQPLKYNAVEYPAIMYNLGWCLSAIGIMQLPGWALYAIVTQKATSWGEKITAAFRPTFDWGPLDPKLLERYRQHVDEYMKRRRLSSQSIWSKIGQNIFD